MRLIHRHRNLLKILQKASWGLCTGMKLFLRKNSTYAVQAGKTRQQHAGSFYVGWLNSFESVNGLESTQYLI